MHAKERLIHSWIFKLSLFLVGITTLSFVSLISTTSFADDSVISDVSISVPVSCSFSDDTTPGVHTATIDPGIYRSEIGYTNFTVFCNDGDGFALYAIGYSNEEYGNTTLIGNGTGQTIATGIATSGSTSNWAMKMIKDTNGYQPNNLTIESAPNVSGGANASFANYHTVPSVFTKVANYSASTDTTIGSKLQSTYAAFISSDQMADTYVGKVRYTLVYPHDANAPEDPRFIAKLDTGQNVNVKLKTLAGVADPSIDAQDDTITALKRANALPSGFNPSTTNTISTSDSTLPVYAWYDSNDATIYYYSEANRIYMNEDSSSFFDGMFAISDLSTIATWNTSKVTNMSAMFHYAGYSATTFNLDLSSWNTASVTDMSYMFNEAGHNATTFNPDLSSWNTASVTDMSYMFQYAGHSATTWSVGDLSSWNTASVTDMSTMFSGAGYNATTFTLDLSSWNTASVTDMSYMFQYAGYSSGTWSVGDLSSWNTASVTTMKEMFGAAGYSSGTWSVGDLSSWNTASVTNIKNMFSNAGRSATTWSVGDLSSWNTASVTDMSYTFYYAGYSATTFNLDLSSWSTASVTNMSYMFSNAGYSSGTWSVGDLSSWKTASVTNMNQMFYSAGYSATTFNLDLSSWNTASVRTMQQMFNNAGYSSGTWSVGDLSSWNTASVTNIKNMFSNAGRSATTWSVGDLSSWNTASVTDMSYTFYYAGYSATTFNLDLSSWNTAEVMKMDDMFTSAGYSATTWSVKIPRTNGAASAISNTTSRFYGRTTARFATPPSGKSFTLAN